jgi:hypothetical protein
MMYFLVVSFPETKCITSPASAAMSLNFARKGLPEAALLEAGVALRVATPCARTQIATPVIAMTQIP